MEAFHDSRDGRYRMPIGAIAAGETVELALDVRDAPGASVLLRTWVDGQGEARYPMSPEGAGADDSSGCPNATRYRVALTPQQASAVWYQFVIVGEDGSEVRYGARDGQLGGTGQLLGWEPPSFLLAVCGEDGCLPAFLEERGVPDVAGALVRFLRGEGSAHELASSVEELCDHFPAKVAESHLRALENVDREQLAIDLSGALDMHASVYASTNSGAGTNVGENGQAAGSASNGPFIDNGTGFAALDEGRQGLAKGRLWCASLVQTLGLDAIAKHVGGRPHEDAMRAAGHTNVAATAPAGAGEDADGSNARAWDAIDADCGHIARNVADLVCALPPFASGDARIFAANDDVLGIERRAEDGTVACVLVNASQHNACDVALPLEDEAVSDVLGGYAVPAFEGAPDTAAETGAVVIDAAALGTAARDGRSDATGSGEQHAPRHARPHLYQVGSSVLYFHPHQRLGKDMQPGLGVLAHITSLPSGTPENETTSKHETARATEANGEHAVEAETGIAAESATGTVGAPARAFVDWLAQAGARYWQVLPVNPTDEYGSPYAGISAFAGNARLLELAPDPARPDPEVSQSADFREFCEREAAWLEPYACFMAIRRAQGEGKAWQDWPKKYRRFDAKTARVVQGDATLSALAETCRQEQFSFDRQWRALRAYANEKGVQIVGDMPLYVSADSADAWANPELFQLGEDGRPRMVAGCPPDSFAADGQVWGNPLYDWDAHASDGFAWWMARLKRAFELYDWVRLDHFIGFARYFSIPAGETASAGQYRPGPGLQLFQKARDEFGELPVIAEDLGSITPAVRALVAACGFPGMDIVQFVDGNDPLSGYAPRPEKVAYTGTHDNQTLVGYCQQRYPHLDAHDAARTLAQAVVGSAAPVAVVALQDVLDLGDEARMNVPGTASGNWTWQARATDVAAALPRLQELAAIHEEATR